LGPRSAAPPQPPDLPLAANLAIESERLLIRPVVEADLAALLVVNGDDAVTRYLPYESWKNEDDARSWYARMGALQAAGTAWQFVVAQRAAGAVVGSCVLFRYEPPSARAELGYVLGRAHWGQGYMREALRAFVGWGVRQLALRRIEAEVDPRNTRSARLLAQLGFAHEGRLRQRWYTKGEACDSDVYGLLSREWPQAD
jgi:[ribosomal protein S5]-alanine N-acetyltransferase